MFTWKSTLFLLRTYIQLTLKIATLSKDIFIITFQKTIHEAYYFIKGSSGENDQNWGIHN